MQVSSSNMLPSRSISVLERRPLPPRPPPRHFGGGGPSERLGLSCVLRLNTQQTDRGRPLRPPSMAEAEAAGEGPAAPSSPSSPSTSSPSRPGPSPSPPRGPGGPQGPGRPRGQQRGRGPPLTARGAEEGEPDLT